MRGFLAVVGCVALCTGAAWGASSTTIANRRSVEPAADGCAPVSAPGTLAPPRASDVAYDTDAPDVPLDGSTKVGPPVIDVDEPLVPGDGFECTVTVRNRRQSRTTFDLIPQGILGGRDGTRYVDLDDPDADATAASWISAPSGVTLEPREIARIPVRVVVPDDPPVGSAAAALTIAPRTRAGATAGDTALGIEGRIAVAFLLKLGGGGEARLRLQEGSAPRLRWDRDPWTWRATLVNRGTLHASPAGRVRVRSVLGNVVTELPLAGRPLLPRGEQRLERTWKGVPWFGLYRWDARVGGRDDDVAAARASGWFIALPPWRMLALSALAIVLLLGRRLTRHRLDHVDDLDDLDDDSFDELR